MAKRREQPENLEQTKRISPYQQMDDDYEDDDQHLVDGTYDDAYADEYHGGYDDERRATSYGGPLQMIDIAALIALLFSPLPLVSSKPYRTTAALGVNTAC